MKDMEAPLGENIFFNYYYAPPTTTTVLSNHITNLWFPQLAS